MAGTSANRSHTENNALHQLLQDAGRDLDALRMQGQPQHRQLAYLAGASEKVSGQGSAASILVLDENGLLRNGASPRLPADYLTAIDGLRPAPNLGTCCAAAATGEIVFTPDFLDDEKWSELKHLPRSIGYAGAWSVPVKNKNGRVLGTFGTYFSEKRKPSPAEIYVNRQLALLAAEVIESAG